MSEQSEIRSVSEIISFLEKRWKEKNPTNRTNRGVSTQEIMIFLGHEKSYQSRALTSKIRELFRIHNVNWQCSSRAGFVPQYQIFQEEKPSSKKNNLPSLIQDMDQQLQKILASETDPRIHAIERLCSQHLSLTLEAIKAIVSIQNNPKDNN